MGRGFREMKLSNFLLASAAFAAPQQASNAVVLSGQSTFRPPGAQLIAAVEKDKKDEAKELILGSKVGYEPVDVNSQNYLGRSVLQCAAREVNIEMVKLKFDAAEEAGQTIDL